MKLRNNNKKLVVCCDLDGVVSEFINNACLLLKQMYGKPDKPITTREIKTWGLDCFDIPDYKEDDFWKRVGNTENFWFNQQELYPGIVRQFGDVINDHTVLYWVTSKCDTLGSTAELQCQLWLQKFGIPNPLVIVTKNKGDICKVLNADMFCDDKGANILDTMQKSPETACYFLHYQYQNEWVDKLQDLGATIIDHPYQFVQAIKKLQDTQSTIEKPLSVCCK